jgi:hypothetical protein
VFEIFLTELPLLFFDIEPLTLDFEAKASEDGHIQIGYPYEGKSGEQITSPRIEKQPIACDRQPEHSDIVTQAKLARQCIKELALNELSALPTAIDAVLMRFTEDLFVRNRP